MPPAALSTGEYGKGARQGARGFALARTKDR
jgi:hypothetical protein